MLQVMVQVVKLNWFHGVVDRRVGSSALVVGNRNDERQSFSRISNLTFFLHESPQFKAIQNTTQSRKDRRKSPFHQDSRVKALKLASGRLYISDVQRPPRNSRLPCFDDERIFMRYTDLTRDGGSL